MSYKHNAAQNYQTEKFVLLIVGPAQRLMKHGTKKGLYEIRGAGLMASQGQLELCE